MLQFNSFGHGRKAVARSRFHKQWAVEYVNTSAPKAPTSVWHASSYRTGREAGLLKNISHLQFDSFGHRREAVAHPRFRQKRWNTLVSTF